MSNKAANIEKYKPGSRHFLYKNFPLYWNARVAELYAQRMKKVLRKSDITITGWRIGMVLREHKSLSISELSTHCSFNPSRVTKTAYAMQAKGWLLISQSQSDGRISEVKITRAGQRLMQQLIENTSRAIDTALDNLSESDLLLINKLLKKLAANLTED